jgi:hypothetical protein
MVWAYAAKGLRRPFAMTDPPPLPSEVDPTASLPREQAGSPLEPSRDPTQPHGSRQHSDAILPFGTRLDEIAQAYFNRTDWIELAAAILLALATVVAAWSAYQATRWGGVQANSFSAASAKRVEATQAVSIYAAQVQIDVESWLTWIDEFSQGDEEGMAFLEDRFRDGFQPAFQAWLAQVPAGQMPPGTPFDMEEYQPSEEADSQTLNAQAEALSAEARDANQRGDNFVLVAVIMASVLFFAGVGTKLKARAVRLLMLVLGSLFFLIGFGFMVSMPQNVGI